MKSKLQGALLRIERLRQNKGQKEVCYGICVPSYLSKIEHGTVKPDEEIVHKLFEKMNLTFYTEEEVPIKLHQNIKAYFEKCIYALDRKAIYEELHQQEQVLRYSELVIDWLLIQGLEGENVLAFLKELEDCMSRRQKAYYLILCYWNDLEAKEAESWCRYAVEVLDNSFAYEQLLYFYFAKANYTAIHQMESRVTAVAMDEGNTYYLAKYYFLKGSAYASLNMEALMMQCYQRSIRFLENTAWTEELKNHYYNIGATYISLKKYDEAITYLKKANPHLLMYHKLALAHIRKGEVEAGKEFLAKMKKEIEKNLPLDETELLRYQEACMECEQDFLERPEYLELLEKLIVLLKKNRSYGHLFFYKEVIVAAYKHHRKYKKALEFEEELSRENEKRYI